MQSSDYESKANCKKSAKNRDYSFAANNHKNRTCVKAINQTRQEAVYFNSMYAVQQHLGIYAGIVKMICEGINNCKTGISKTDGHYYKFQTYQKNLRTIEFNKIWKMKMMN